MIPRIFCSRYHVFNHIFIAVFLCIIASQAQCNTIYAYIDAQGTLLISEKKNDARFKRFYPNQRITPRISPQTTPQKTGWIPSNFSSERAALFAMQQAKSARLSTANLPTHKKAQHYAPLINTIATEVGVNPDLLHAMIQVESAYNPNAVSPKGAQGLMQLIPATATRFGVGQSVEPADNVRGGARYIKNLLVLFNNNVPLALAAYNAGEGAVQKYNNTIPPYPETQAYVNRVISLFEQRGEFTIQPATNTPSFPRF